MLNAVPLPGHSNICVPMSVFYHIGSQPFQGSSNQIQVKMNNQPSMLMGRVNNTVTLVVENGNTYFIIDQMTVHQQLFR